MSCLLRNLSPTVKKPVYHTGYINLSNSFVLQIDQVELWEAQSKNPGPLEFQLSQGSTAFAEELEAQDLVFRMDGGRITDILAHPEEPSHVLNIKRGILSALQVQFVDEHATLEEVRCLFLDLALIIALIRCTVVFRG